jgi:hypothetical protein
MYFYVLCVCGLPNDASHCRMTDELERIRRQAVVVRSRYYPSIPLEKLRKIRKSSVSVPDSETQRLQNTSVECYL